MSSYGPAFPGEQPAATAGVPDRPPSGVRTAVLLAYVIAALDLIGIAISFTTLDAVRASARATSIGTTSQHTVVVVAIVGFIVYGVVAAALWALFAWFTGRGRGWARIVLIVLSALTVVSGLFSLVGFTIVSLDRLVELALAVAIIVLLSQQPARAWFAARSAASRGAGGYQP